MDDSFFTDLRVLNSRTMYLFTGVRIPYAADLYNDALTIPIVIQSLAYDALLLLVFTLIYMIGVKFLPIFAVSLHPGLLVLYPQYPCSFSGTRWYWLFSFAA